MRYSFMSFSTPTLDLHATLEAAATLGYQGIEPRAQAGHAHGIERTLSAAGRIGVRRLCEGAGVEIACLAVSCRFANPAEAPAHVDDAAAFIHLAADIGCNRLRVFGGALPGGMARAEAVAQVAGCLAELAPAAQREGVTLCLETHDDWCNPDDVVAVMQAVGQPSVAVNWDIMHTQRQGRHTMAEAYAKLRPWVRHLHVHDGVDSLAELKVLPTGTGDFDHREAMRLLLADGYDGYLSGEWIEGTSEPEFQAGHLSGELATLKSYEANLRREA